MKLPSLHTFKQARKNYGTIGSIYWFLSCAEIREDCVDHAVDGFSTELGVRVLEQAKSKELYQLLDGYALAYQEHFVPTAN